MDPTDLLLFAQNSGVLLHYSPDSRDWHARLGLDSSTGPTPREAIQALHARITYIAPPPTYAWKRSLHHDWAHLVSDVDGIALCSARIPLGSLWHPAEETRPCKRCTGQAKEQGVVVAEVGDPS